MNSGLTIIFFAIYQNFDAILYNDDGSHILRLSGLISKIGAEMSIKSRKLGVRHA
jgi:hypothetical protein